MTAASALFAENESPEPEAAAIELRGVSKWYSLGQAAIRNVSLRIPHGCLTSLIGPSGCGKSTLLRLIAGLERPDGGRLRLHGQDITDQDPTQRDVGLVPQNYALFPHLSVLENIRYGLSSSVTQQPAAKDRARAVLKLVDLEGYESRSTASLSGGEQQRVALARALASEPRVLLLDEPLSSVDSGLRRQLREQICDIQKAFALTVVYVTHDQSEALAVGDHVVVMHDGEVLQDGTPRDVYLTPSSEVVAGIMGAAMFLPAQVVEAGVVELYGYRMALPDASDVGACVTLLIRPEAWQVGAAGSPGFAGKILSCTYFGRGSEYLIQLEWGDVLATVWGAHAPYQIGSPVTVLLNSASVRVSKHRVPAGPAPP
jgi:iron(III) transport system ATP-binding protein